MTEPPGPLALAGTPTWAELLSRRSFAELDARSRALALLDEGTARELCDPFDQIESPWLEAQGIVPQSDDGLVVARSTVGGAAVTVISIDQNFAGGATGEVSGPRWQPPSTLPRPAERGRAYRPSCSSKPAVCAFRRPTSASRQSPRSALRC